MSHADMVAKPEAETPSWLPAHHCNGHNMSPAKQRLHEGPAHQVLATPPKPLPDPDI